MTDTKSKTGRWWKIPAVMAAILLLFVAGIALFSQTEMFRNIVRREIESAVSSYVKGSLYIGSLDGNFFSHVTARDIFLIAQGDTVIHLGRLALHYDLSGIPGRRVHINSILIDSPRVALRQTGDTTWNVTNLLVGQGDTSSSPFTWLITVDTLSLRTGVITIAQQDSSAIIPQRIDEITAQLSAAYGRDMFRMHLQDFRFNTLHPDFSLRRLSFLMESHDDEILVKDLVIQTAKNRLDAHADIATSEDSVSQGTMDAPSFDFSEFSGVMPELRLYGKPTIDASLWYKLDSVHVNLGVVEGTQHLRAAIGMRTSKQSTRYTVDCRLGNINVGRWLNDTSMTTNLGGRIRGSWIGSTLTEASFALAADLSGSTLLGRRLDTLVADVQSERGVARCSFLAGPSPGMVRGNGTLNIQDSSFSFTGTIRNLNAAEFSGNVKTDISMSFSGRGKGLSPENLSAIATVQLAPSSVNGMEIRSALANLHSVGSRYSIDTLVLHAAAGDIVAAGTIDRDAFSELDIQGHLKTLLPLGSLAHADTLAGAGKFSASVRGTTDSLAAELQLRLGQCQYNAVFVDSIAARMTVLVRSLHSFAGNLNTEIADVRAGSLQLDNARATSDFSDSLQTLAVTFRGADSLSGELQLMFRKDSTIRLMTIPSVALAYKGQFWQGGSDSMGIEKRGTTYEVHNLAIASGEQRLSVSGSFSTDGQENLHLAVRRLDIQRALALGGVDQNAGGVFDGNLFLAGTADDPGLNGTLTISNGFINAFRYDSLSLMPTYGEKKLRWTAVLAVDGGSRVTSRGFLPLDLSFHASGPRLQKGEPMQADLKTSRLPLDVLQAGIRDVQAGGILACDLKVTNTLQEPYISGMLQIDGGSITYPSYGIEYKDIQMRFDVEKDRVRVTRCSLQGGDGRLTASGEATFAGDLASTDLRSAGLEFTAQDFAAASGRDVEIVITGNANLGGDVQSPRYAGDVTVVRSRLWIPKFTDKLDTKQSNTSLPLLLAATSPADTSVSRRVQLATVPQRTPREYLQNLRGSLKLTFPKNTWLRSPDMKIEVAGSLDIVKNGELFELFGEIRTVRGTYDILGKRFDISSGLLLFQGGKEYNPEVDISAEYTFRDAERQKRLLDLHITGKAFSPKLAFTLDQKSIELADAVAYLTFGKSFSELSVGQKSTASQGSVALGFAAGELSAALSKATGLDMFEIRGGETLQQSTIAVGQYLSDDLFVSLETQLGKGESDQAAPQIITLEYELTKFLFLQLIEGDPKKSGIDLFVKIEH